ncbi:MAG: hypothetical protein P8Z31_07660 [Gammaproteobacteria bacterium]|jgi:hypothetical protein
MPKEYYYPDHKEPHIHVHKGGATFTDITHNHRNLYMGDKVYAGVVQEVLADLADRGDPRSMQIHTWITQNV